MAAAVTDEHMGRARSLLYDWAESQRPEIQHIVLAVCQQLIVSKESMALVRIRRVANNAAESAFANKSWPYSGIRQQIKSSRRGSPTP